MPIFNGEKHIEVAVESVLSQTFEDFELLLLDDGSADRSIEIITRFAKRDERCKIHSWPNRGVVLTRNDGIELARGEILIYMDCDDICLPHRFEKQIAYLNAHPDCVAVGSRVFLIDSEGMPICEFGNEFTHEEIDAAHICGKGGSRICLPSAAMRKEAVLRIGKFRGELASDIDLFLRLAEIGKLANLPEVLLEYRQHLNSIGYAYTEKQLSGIRNGVNLARMRRGLPVLSATDGNVTSVQTSSDAHRKWAWWALSAGHLITARKHALKAFAMNPFNFENFRIIACVIRGR